MKNAASLLPDEVIDSLFSALSVRYGAPFLDRWRDLELAAVKGDWARELAGFASNLGAFRFALDHLPERPPTVIEFRKLCNAAPAAQHQRIGHDAPVRGPNAEEKAAIKRMADDIRKGEFFAKPGRQWAYRLLDRHENGDPRPMECVAMARRALGIRPPDIDETPLSQAEEAIAQHDMPWQQPQEVEHEH